MEKRISWWLIGLFLVANLLVGGASVAAKDGVYEVVSPVGETTVEMLPPTPRLDTLEGKTICEVSSEIFKTEVTFPKIRELLKKKYPGVKVIPYTEMPVCTIETMGPDTRAKTIKSLIAAFKEKGCDAVISGNGG